MKYTAATALAACLAVLALAACSKPAPATAPAAAPAPAPAAQEGDAALIATAQAQVKQGLALPASASFGNVFVSRISGKPVVCGFVSSNLPAGGNTGDLPFYSAGQTPVVITNDTFAAFRASWIQLCGPI